MQSKLFVISIIGLMFMIAFAGCTSSDVGNGNAYDGTGDDGAGDLNGDAGTENETGNETDEDITEIEAPKQIIEKITVDFTVTFGIQTYRLVKDDATFDAKTNCLGIVAKIDGGGSSPMGSSYTFEMWDSTFNAVAGSGTKVGIVDGSLPLEMRIPAEALKNYTDGEIFHITIFCNDGAQIQDSYTATIDMYYIVPLEK